MIPPYAIDDIKNRIRANTMRINLLCRQLGRVPLWNERNLRIRPNSETIPLYHKHLLEMELITLVYNVDCLCKMIDMTPRWNDSDLVNGIVSRFDALPPISVN